MYFYVYGFIDTLRWLVILFFPSNLFIHRILFFNSRNVAVLFYCSCTLQTNKQMKNVKQTILFRHHHSNYTYTINTKHFIFEFIIYLIVWHIFVSIWCSAAFTFNMSSPFNFFDFHKIFGFHTESIAAFFQKFNKIPGIDSMFSFSKYIHNLIFYISIEIFSYLWLFIITGLNTKTFHFMHQK